MNFPLDWIELRCRRDEDTGCLLWRQLVNPSGAPVATKLTPDGRKPTVQVRREVWEQRHGPIPDGFLVAVSCGNPRCLEHLELITKSEVMRRQWARTDVRAKRTAGVTRASRKHAKVDMETAREIRASNETLEQVAERLAISTTLASMIRRGVRWQELADPFAGLGARNA